MFTFFFVEFDCTINNFFKNETHQFEFMYDVFIIILITFVSNRLFFDVTIIHFFNVFETLNLNEI